MDTSPSQEPQSLTSDLANYSGEVVSVDQQTVEFVEGQHARYFLLLILGSLLLGTLIAGIQAYWGWKYYQDPFTYADTMLFGLFPLAIPVIAFFRVRARMQDLLFRQVSTDLNCTYSPTRTIPTDARLTAFGHSQTYTNVMSGTYKNTPLEMGNYTYVTGSGKSAVVHQTTLSQITVAFALPHIVCVPKAWDSDFLIHPWKTDATEKLSLEGNFNSKFSVYVEKGKETETLQVLEPNIMINLIEEFGNYGFECIGSHLYLFTGRNMGESRNSIIGNYNFFQKFFDLLQPELESFSR